MCVNTRAVAQTTTFTYQGKLTDANSAANGNYDFQFTLFPVLTGGVPAYFETLNRDFRYQLTVIGRFAQAIIASKIKDNRFTIQTDKPLVEVSWQVTGIRQDPYARANPIIVEEPKKDFERGFYLNPELYGKTAEHGFEQALRAEQLRRAKAQEKP